MSNLPPIDATEQPPTAMETLGDTASTVGNNIRQSAARAQSAFGRLFYPLKESCVGFFDRSAPEATATANREDIIPDEDVGHMKMGGDNDNEDDE